MSACPAGPWILPHKGRLPSISERAFVLPTATIVGDVEIGDLTSVWFGAVVRGDVYEIRIGSRSNLQDGTIVHGTGGRCGACIGNYVSIGHGAIIHGCRLGDVCLIGMRACILDEAVVESGAMVAAGAVVLPRARVPSGELWGGVPARKLRDLSEADLMEIHATADRYVQHQTEYF